MEKLLCTIIQERGLHQRWLETLSHLENRGARKIHAVQPSANVPFALLQHAAEEARHALVFKVFSRKLGVAAAQDGPALLGQPYGKRYLDVLDLVVSRCVRRRLSLSPQEFRHACYLLTTYAIELRAEWLYPLYDSLLVHYGQAFSLKEIIREEEQHLKLIHQQLSHFPGLEDLLPEVRAAEEQLFARWKARIEDDVYRKGQ